MKVLVIGSGGREHALCWRLARSPAVTQLFAAPGNPGMAKIARCVPAASSPDALLAAAEEVDADLTIVGPEAPLVAGMVDLFRLAGRAIVGPNAAAARLEGSKIFAKEFLSSHRIPTAEFVAAATPEEARKALARFRFPVVVKADGLAGGKGVTIAHDRADAERAINHLGGRLVIEEFLEGEEVSFIALTDGREIVSLEPAQDHKAVNDGDTGPNTGGMGAYCDSRILTGEQTAMIMNKIMRPAVEATQFTGFLYAGMMLTSDGPKVLEFNVRLGDPETQPLMLRLKSDFASVLLDAAHGRLSGKALQWSSDPAVCVVLASAGYPGEFRTGIPIHGVEEAEAVVFHAGTRIGPACLETAGGRVLGVTSSGASLSQAIDQCYAAVRQIHFDGMHYRSDIGRKGLKRYNTDTRARSSDG